MFSSGNSALFLEHFFCPSEYRCQKGPQRLPVYVVIPHGMISSYRNSNLLLSVDTAWDYSRGTTVGRGTSRE